MLLEFFAENVDILVISLATYNAGTIAALIFYMYDKHRALRVCEEIDKSRAQIMGRVGVKKYFTAAAHGSLVTSAILIFLWNLTFGSLLWSLIMGILILPPLIFLAITGFFVTLMFVRFSGSIVGGVVAVIFEISAYLIASTIGITIGLGLFAVKPSPILLDVIGSFAFVVVPLQTANGVTEAYMTYLTYFRQGKPLPSWWHNATN